jgi:hypothetical protein
LKDGGSRIGVGVTGIVLGIVCVIMVNVCNVVLDVVCVIIMDVCCYGKEIQFSKLVFTILVNKQNYYYMSQFVTELPETGGYREIKRQGT